MGTGLIGTSGAPLKAGQAPQPPAKRCGNCHFGVICTDGDDAVQCEGVPPTPVPMSAGADLAGQPVMQLALFRPRLSPMQHACAHWAPREGEPRFTAPPQHVGRRMAGPLGPGHG